MRTTVTLPLALLDHQKAHPRTTSSVNAVAAAYTEGRDVPPIPVHVSRDGRVKLKRDGNHRLAAARQAGLREVLVCIDARDLHRLRAVIAAQKP